MRKILLGVAAPPRSLALSSGLMLAATPAKAAVAGPYTTGFTGVNIDKTAEATTTPGG